MNTKTSPIDIQTLRRRARQHIEEGAVTEDYKADRNAVLERLSEALAIPRRAE